MTSEYLLLVPSGEQLGILLSINDLLIDSENVMMPIEFIYHPWPEILPGAYLIVFDKHRPTVNLLIFLSQQDWRVPQSIEQSINFKDLFDLSNIVVPEVELLQHFELLQFLNDVMMHDLGQMDVLEGDRLHCCSDGEIIQDFKSISIYDQAGTVDLDEAVLDEASALERWLDLILLDGCDSFQFFLPLTINQRQEALCAIVSQLVPLLICSDSFFLQSFIFRRKSSFSAHLRRNLNQIKISQARRRPDHRTKVVRLLRQGVSKQLQIKKSR